MSTAPRQLRIGVLGCGPIAQFAHFDACKKARNAELYAICDVAADLRERMAAIHQPAKVYASDVEMLADPEVEAVLIAVADQFHVPACLKAIDAGKHVLVEKPLGTVVGDCQALLDRARYAGVRIQVGNNRRFDPGIAFAQRFVREEMGQMLSLKAWYWDSTYRYTMTDNLQPIPFTSEKALRPAGDPKADKRRYFLMTHGSHLVDTARYFGGPIVGLSARLVEKFGAYCWFSTVEFESGAIGHLDLSIPVRGDFAEGFQIQGELGSVQGRVHLPWYHKAADVECFSTRSGQFTRPLGADAHTYKRQVEGFAAAILEGQAQAGASLEDGLAAVQALVAIARSVENGGAFVRLDETSGAV